MKYIITGMHCSGKQEVLDILKNNGIRCGKLFTNLDSYTTSNIYNSSNYKTYSDKDIHDIFENNAYIFMQEFPFLDQLSAGLIENNYYEGLSLYEFENNDVFIMSPDQLFSINPASVKNDIVFVWIDNTKKERLNKYYSDKRDYNFFKRDEIELKDANSFVKLLYGFNKSNVLYFTNEEPSRIAAIIYSAIKHPDLLPFFIEAFN